MSPGRSEGSSLTPSPVHPRDALVQQIFDRAVSGIVLARMTRIDATALFQTYVDQGVPPSDRVVCTYHLAAKLDQFRAADASRYGLTPVHVDAWRQVYDRPPASAPRLGGVPPSADRPPEVGSSSPSSPVRRPPSDPVPAAADTADIGPDERTTSDAPGVRKGARRRSSEGSELPAAVRHLPSGAAGLLAAIQTVFPSTRTPEGKIIAGTIIAAAAFAAPRLFAYSPWTGLIWPALTVGLVLWARRKAAAVRAADVNGPMADGGSAFAKPPMKPCSQAA